MCNDKPAARRKPITLNEIQQSFNSHGAQYGPILSLTEASKLSGLAESTLKKKVSEGAFADAVKRGKPLLFWRDRFVTALMNGSPPAQGKSKTIPAPQNADREADNEIH